MLVAASLFVQGCHTEPPPEAASAGDPRALPAPSAASSNVTHQYRCTLVLGLAVTSEWYRAGFERFVDDDRWEAITKPHTFVENWADPNHPVWRELPQSPCTERWTDPDRVLFFAANFTFTARAEWDKALSDVVTTLRAKYPRAERIELLPMVRAPGNVSCGSEKGIVNPIIDASLEATSARFPELVSAGPHFEVKSCEDLEKGGPHFSQSGRPAVAKLIADHYEVAPAARVQAP
jgi:hypothetical protein